jgi:YidC/Oxa1 family membrane protein insertase
LIGLPIQFNTRSNASSQTSELFFQPGAVQKNTDGSQTVDYVLNGDNGTSVTHHFKIGKNAYLIDFNIELNGANTLLTQGLLNMRWQNQGSKHEREVITSVNNLKLDFWKMEISITSLARVNASLKSLFNGSAYASSFSILR